MSLISSFSKSVTWLFQTFSLCPQTLSPLPFTILPFHEKMWSLKRTSTLPITSSAFLYIPRERNSSQPDVILSCILDSTSFIYSRKPFQEFISYSVFFFFYFLLCHSHKNINILLSLFLEKSSLDLTSAPVLCSRTPRRSHFDSVSSSLFPLSVKPALIRIWST